MVHYYLGHLAGYVVFAEWAKEKRERFVFVLHVEKNFKGDYSPLRKVLGTVGDWLGCHQLPERSFFYKGVQFPLCARCTGVLIGQTIMLVISFTGIFIPFWAGFLLLSPMGIDWSLQYFAAKESTNMRRLISGFLGGCGYIAILAKLAMAIINRY